MALVSHREALFGALPLAIQTGWPTMVHVELASWLTPPEVGEGQGGSGDRLYPSSVTSSAGIQRSRSRVLNACR